MANSLFLRLTWLMLMPMSHTHIYARTQNTKACKWWPQAVARLNPVCRTVDRGPWQVMRSAIDSNVFLFLWHLYFNLLFTSDGEVSYIFLLTSLKQLCGINKSFILVYVLGFRRKSRVRKARIALYSFLWPCIVSKVWREKNQQDAIIGCLL